VRNPSFTDRCAPDAEDTLRSVGKPGRLELLHGIVKDGASRASRLLGALDVDRGAFLDLLRGERDRPGAGRFRLALDLGASEAALEGCGEIDTAHLLVGLARGVRAGHELWRRPLPASFRLAAAWPAGDVAVWDLARERGPVRLDAGRATHCVTADATWRHVAAGCDDGRLDVWDLDEDLHVRFREGHAGPVRAVAWSPVAPHILTGSEDGTARVWDAETGTVLWELAGHDGPVRTVCYNPQGELIYTGSDDCTIRVWYARSGLALDTLEGHAASVLGLHAQPEGPLLSRSEDDDVIRWTIPPTRRPLAEDPLAPVFARFALTADQLRKGLARA